MHFKFRGVNDAFKGLVSGLHSGEIPTIIKESRAGEVMLVEEPVIVTYSHPRERVLFNQSRDANPFFHLFESLWMLAGRNDVAPLAYYNSQIAYIASDDGRMFNGAYGYRWRHAQVDDYIEDRIDSDLNGIDQLKIIIDQLKRKPESRRVVLQMWNTQDDLLKIDESKDVCCNTHVYFSVETGTCTACGGAGHLVEEGFMSSTTFKQNVDCPKCNGMPHDVPRYLNMTVCNRSNDLIWGLLGANVCHFSFLQEYIANCIGLEVGTYNQFTNNMHCYTERWEPEKWLGTGETMSLSYRGADYGSQSVLVSSFPLVQDQETFDRECAEFIDNKDWTHNWKEPFLQRVATPMCWAFHLHKERKYGMALAAIEEVRAEDWRIAGRNWIEKRKLNWEREHEKVGS